MQLIAAKSMTYATRRLTAGDLFTASAKDARILLALKRARMAEAEDAQPKPVEKTPVKAKSRKRATKAS